MHSRLQIIHLQFILKSVCVGLVVGIAVSCFSWSIEKSYLFGNCSIDKLQQILR